MKMIAKANISGPFGRVDKGAEFTTDAPTGKELVERGLAEAAAPAKLQKPDKASPEAE